MRSAKNEELLTVVLQCFFAATKKDKLDKDIVDQAIADVKYIFSKDPEAKDSGCIICNGLG